MCLPSSTSWFLVSAGCIHGCCRPSSSINLDRIISTWLLPSTSSCRYSMWCCWCWFGGPSAWTCCSGLSKVTLPCGVGSHFALPSMTIVLHTLNLLVSLSAYHDCMSLSVLVLRIELQSTSSWTTWIWWMSCWVPASQDDWSTFSLDTFRACCFFQC